MRAEVVQHDRDPGVQGVERAQVPGGREERRAVLGRLDVARDSVPGRDWAREHNVELAYTPTNSSWLNRIAAPFPALRYCTLDGTDHASVSYTHLRAHETKANLVCRL